MVIAVIGGGNIGTLMAAEFASRGHEVRLCASDAERWQRVLEVYDRAGTLSLTGELSLVSSDVRDVAAGADYIWITYPTSQFSGLAARLVPLLEAGQKICVVPGADAEFFFGDAVHRGVTLLGLQRVHGIARIRERGKSVYSLGRKDEVQLASIPSGAAAACAGEVAGLFDLPVRVLPTYLVETLTPSNPILHTARIATMFADWHEGEWYSENILFYESWTRESSELLLACDNELQMLCRRLERCLGVDLAEVRSLREHYESPTAEALTAKISAIPAFRGLVSPMREEELGHWVPDFASRYFQADFAYGLKAIRDIARLVGVSTPSIERVWQWYLRASGDAGSFDGVPPTIEGLASLYQ